MTLSDLLFDNSGETEKEMRGYMNEKNNHSLFSIVGFDFSNQHGPPIEWTSSYSSL
jgi:hypothetical protein